MVQNISNTQVELEDLRRFVESNLSDDPIDAALYASALDSDYKIDSKLLQDPVFLAFWKLQYLTFLETVDPTPINSNSGEIGEQHLEAAYTSPTANLESFNQDLAAADPEIAAYLEYQNGEAGSQTESLLSALTTAQQTNAASQDETHYNDTGSTDYGNATTSGAGPQYMMTTDGTSTGSESGSYYDQQTIIAEDARALGEKLGFGEDSFYWNIVATEEGSLSAMSNILGTLSEMDQAQVDITEALKSGAISAEEFDSKSSNISIYRETMLSMLTQLSQSLMTMMEMYSKLISQANEGTLKTIEKWKV